MKHAVLVHAQDHRQSLVQLSLVEAGAKPDLALCEFLQRAAVLEIPIRDSPHFRHLRRGRVHGPAGHGAETCGSHLQQRTA